MRDLIKTLGFEVFLGDKSAFLLLSSPLDSGKTVTVKSVTAKYPMYGAFNPHAWLLSPLYTYFIHF